MKTKLKQTKKTSYGTKEETWKGQISEKNNDHEKNLLQCAVSQKNPSEMHNRENIQLLPPKIFREEKQ